MYSFIDYRVVYLPVEGNILAKIRNGNPKIQVWMGNCKFFVKIRQNVGIFFRRRKNRSGKNAAYLHSWKNGGIWDRGGCGDAGRRDAMHRVSTGGIGDGISDGSGRRRIPERGV
jgi:hypothetical protein